MIKLADIDKKAEEKGSKIKTLWQFIKFSFASMFAAIAQFITLNTLNLLPVIRRLETVSFNWFVFSYPVSDGGLAYFISFNAANILAQIIAFFVNREKTFNANNNIPVTLTIYLIFTVALLCFSAWLSPTVNGFLIAKGLPEELSVNIASMVCSLIQFLLYFPVDKMLMREKKK